jgi:hypothetical protein
MPLVYGSSRGRGRALSGLAAALVTAMAAWQPLQAQATIDPAPGTTSALMRLAAGTIPDGIEDLEYQLQNRRLGSGSALRAITELGYEMRGTGPALTATTTDLGILLLVYEAARDTAGVRATRDSIDAARGRLAIRNLPPPLALAQADLFLGDSAAALTRLAAFDASWERMECGVSWGAVLNGWLLGRTWLLMGDLAQALGRQTLAVQAFQRVVDLWANGESDLQPAVARARSALGAAEGGDALRLHGAAPAGDPLTLRARTGTATERFRYDAVLWMQPPVSMRGAAERPMAGMTFVTSERASRRPDGGVTTLQAYDSVILNMPLLDALGADGLALRRQMQSAAGSLRAVTETDSLSHVTRRGVEADGPVPGELQGLLERGTGFGPLAAAAPLPSRAVTVGDAWRDSVPLNIPGAGGEDLRVAATYRLTRIVTAGHRRLAFIAIDAGTTTPRAQQDGGRVSASLTGELVRDMETGETLRLAASLRATVWSASGAPRPVRVLLTALREPSAPVTSIAMR